MDVDKAVAAAKDAFENGEWGRMNARDRGRLMYRYDSFQSAHLATFLVVQWLRVHAPNAEGPGVIAGQGTRSHMLQLKILHAAAKTWCSQINFKKKKSTSLWALDTD